MKYTNQKKYYETHKKEIYQRHKEKMMNDEEYKNKRKQLYKNWYEKNKNNKKDLQQRIDKAIEYIKQYGNLYCLKHTQFKKYKQYEELLEILGDKENDK